MLNFEVEFYRTVKNDCPVQEFLDALNPKMRAKMLRMAMLLEEQGGELREPYSKHLEEGIFELRAVQGSDITRVLYFFMVGRKIILTSGFVKKSKKTPKSELDKAKKYREDYLKRKESQL